MPSASWQIWPQSFPTNFALVWQCKLWQNLEVYEGTYYTLLRNFIALSFFAVMIIMSAFLEISTTTFSFCLTNHFCWVSPCLFGSCQSTTVYRPDVITFTQPTASKHWEYFSFSLKNVLLIVVTESCGDGLLTQVSSSHLSTSGTNESD